MYRRHEAGVGYAQEKDQDLKNNILNLELKDIENNNYKIEINTIKQKLYKKTTEFIRNEVNTLNDVLKMRNEQREVR